MDCLFIGFKPSLGLKCSHACSSVTSAARARKFGRVVLQAWLGLQHTPRQSSDVLPMAGEWHLSGAKCQSQP